MRSSAWLPIAVLGATLFGAGTASAFCRTTTCNASNPSADAKCTYDPDTGCALSGAPLFWPDQCTWFGVQQDGSKKLGISYTTFHSAVATAFRTWASADCGSGTHPSFEITDTDALYGPAVCDQQEFNKQVGTTTTANANVWMFRDSDWPYDSTGNTIALTTLTIDTKTGQIVDSDVEINSAEETITTTGAPGTEDLESIVTHESGHFLGLAHSLVKDATMYAYYQPGIGIRTLATDDEQGICTIYPPRSDAPSCPEPEPLYGFSRYCGGVNPSTQPVPVTTESGGCHCDLAHPNRGSWAWSSIGLAGLLVARRRRRTLQTRSASLRSAIEGGDH